MRRIEAGYRKTIARARDALKDASVDPVKAEKKFKKLKARYEKKIDKLQPKIKALTSRREELKNRNAAKG